MGFAEAGRVVSIDGQTARVATVGGLVDASLALPTARSESVEVGDWVILALGLVLERITGADADRLAEAQRVA